MDEAYRSIEWQSVFLIAGMLPMAKALEVTGVTNSLAGAMPHLLSLAGSQGLVLLVFALFYLMPVYILVITSLKTFAEATQAQMW